MIEYGAHEALSKQWGSEELQAAVLQQLEAICLI